MKYFEDTHQFGDPFDIAVVLLKNIQPIFDLSDFNYVVSASEFQDRINIMQSGQTDSALINHNSIRGAVCLDNLPCINTSIYLEP